MDEEKDIFTEKEKNENKKWKNFLIEAFLFVIINLRFILYMPFIYGMIIPTIILDISLFIYQQTVFRFDWIPLARRKDYIVFDKRFLKYLNPIEKSHCLYCSYVNGVFSYAMEIWGRTEKYWCPIKNSMRMKWGHEWQKYFADYGDAKGYRKTINKLKEEKDKNIIRSCFFK